MNQARAIVWAQWRTARNFYPRGGVAWTAVIGVFWYGFWVLASVAAATLASNRENLNLLRAALPGALLVALLYWQVIPLMMAATGASLDLRKLQPYPIPVSQLFGIEVLLRLTAGIEMVLVLTGIAIGVQLNPALPRWSALGIVPYLIFNLFLAVGLRDLLLRMMARKRIREITVFVLVMCSALPQLLMTRSRVSLRFFAFFSGDAWAGWPWTAAANVVEGVAAPASLAILVLWTLISAWFGHWQFVRTLSFDKEAAAALGSRGTEQPGVLERLFRLPSALLGDPLGALVEKEVRCLARSPRFRLVFLMGFTFGIVILLPVSLHRQSWFGNDYLTGVSVYSLLLLSDVCFWNSFGFDRSAAQIYFLAPVPFARALIGKNLSAVLFIILEITAVTAVCAVIRMPLTAVKVAEAYSVAVVITIFLLSAGNLLSVHQARGVNPGTQIRSNAAGRLQAMLLVVYPVAVIPVALAYAARYVFASEAAFFGVLLFDATVGIIVYRIALESAAHAAENRKEQMIASLSVSAGPITG
jgi:ABC-2 type transport system permease protein